MERAGCGKIFREKVSGGNRDRPQFQRMLDQIRVGDTIVVWKLDRLARSTLFIAGAVLVARVR
jgi:DNA invertase Pin-like site-specific DNA recombinase